MNDRLSARGFQRTKLACYTAYFTMSSVFSLPPLLFVTFHQMYHISYTLLGTLVLSNFLTQLAVDLIFTVFCKHVSIARMLKIMPLLTCLGFVIYALVPTFFARYAYAGLLTGTVIFSLAAGLSEVLLSPLIAALPSDNPKRDMSLLHALYAFGVFTVIAISTIFLKCFGRERWMVLTLFFALLPVPASVLFFCSPIPEIAAAQDAPSSGKSRRKATGLILCFLCIFFGSCAENGMSNWISSYMESALHLDKAVGDILGMAVFAVLLGAARIAYAKFGKNIGKILLIGMAGAALCYLTAGLSAQRSLCFLACILTGHFTAMLWPGTLLLMEENLPGAGVSAYALMAAGGDLGASITPQLMGIVMDQAGAHAVSQQPGAAQLGLKTAMLTAAIFPLLGVVAILLTLRFFSGKRQWI